MTFSLRNVSYRYDGGRRGAAAAAGEMRGIHIDELDIEPVGVTAIIGPSGSGKTTLLSMLAGFIEPEIGKGGHITFAGAKIPRGGHRPGTVSFVFQNPMLMGAANGLVNVIQGQVAARHARHARDPAVPGPDDAAQLRHLARHLGLTGPDGSYLAKRARHLSGGEAQRVSVIRALLADPQAVLCDEPTSALDEFNAGRVMETLHAWAHDRGRAVVWVTHNIEQAARYADHFVFVVRGRALGVPREDAEAIREAPQGDRLDVLKKINVALTDLAHPGGNHRDDMPAALPEPDDADDAIAVPPRQYAGWIANALSTDGLAAELIERNRDASLVGPAQDRFLRRFLPGIPKAASRAVNLLRRAVSYSRYGFALVLFVLFAQIFAAEFFGRLAESYSRLRLEDPSVARIVFEHVIGEDRFGTGVEALPLDPLVGLPNVRAGLAEAMQATGRDPARVAVFGRRTVPGSKLSLPEANEACQGWLPLETTALDVDDPLIRQAGLVRDDPAFPDTATQIQARAKAAWEREVSGETAPGGSPRYALVEAPIVDRLRSICGLDPTGPIEVDWAAGEAGRLAPVRLTIVGSIAEPPPLYPVTAEMIVFEHDYEHAVRAFGGEIDAYRIATAYFPIDGFGTAREVIDGLGYAIRDDSAAAVETLKQVSTLAKRIPPNVIAFNLAGFATLILIVIGGLLELNKRVLALFMAHGFRRRDLVGMLVTHLYPAFLGALVAVGLVFAAVWTWRLGALVADVLGPAGGMGLVAFLRAAVYVVGAGFLAIVVTVLLWWRQTRANLKTYLQE